MCGVSWKYIGPTWINVGLAHMQTGAALKLPRALLFTTFISPPTVGYTWSTAVSSQIKHLHNVASLLVQCLKLWVRSLWTLAQNRRSWGPPLRFPPHLYKSTYAVGYTQAGYSILTLLHLINCAFLKKKTAAHFCSPFSFDQHLDKCDFLTQMLHSDSQLLWVRHVWTQSSRAWS